MHDDWEPASLGVERMDVEHRQILRRLRGLAAAAAGGRPEELRGALRFLTGYLGDHWRGEEAWMAERGYPAAGEHGRQHARLLARIAAARDAGPADRARQAEAAVAIALDVEDHMRSEDLKLGRFHAARENLRLLAEAGPGKGPALTPLPGALPAVRRKA